MIYEFSLHGFPNGAVCSDIILQLLFFFLRICQVLFCMVQIWLLSVSSEILFFLFPCFLLAWTESGFLVLFILIAYVD